MKYDRVLVYTKKGNLLDFMNTERVSQRIVNAESAAKHYGQEKEIQLVACLRCEDCSVSTRKGTVQRPKVFCKIKCPINPLPVKGEFEAPSFVAVQRFLNANGWAYKDKIYPHMFN